MSTQITNDGGTFNIEDLCGYAGVEHPHLLKEAFDLWGDEFPDFQLVGDPTPKPSQVYLFEFVRKVFGKDTPNYAQEVGSCVGHATKNSCEYTQALPILNGLRQIFKLCFEPYLYGTGRVQIGGTRLGWQDGSMGVWAAKAVMAYGVVPADFPGLPAYGGSLDRQWGRAPGPPSQFLDAGKEHLVKSAAIVKSYDDAVDAVKSGYPVSICSDQGFEMLAGSDGYHRASGNWGHNMTLVGVDTGEDSKKPAGCILNSWSDVHGKIVDFLRPDLTWPIGTMRVHPEVIDSMIKYGDSWAYSMFDGFPSQPIPRSIFDIWS